MASIMEEDLGDVKILIIPEASDYKDGIGVEPIITGLKDAALNEELQVRIEEYLKGSAAEICQSTNDLIGKHDGDKNEFPNDNSNSKIVINGKQKLYKTSIVKNKFRSEGANNKAGASRGEDAPVAPKGKHQCRFCHKAFNHKSTLSRHKLLAHTVNPPVFICAHCNKKYKTKVSLRRHLQSVGNNAPPRKSGLKVNCALCQYTCDKSQMLYHYETFHNTVIEKEIIKFDNEDEFFLWKQQTENETTARFTKIRKDRIIKDGTKESFYRCHRDGFYKPRGNNLRNLKKMGSNKINGHCPAKMQVWINYDHEVSVMFVKTHVGHEMEISRLTLTKQERDHIAQQLALQVPFDAILEACRESAVGAENIRRMNLLTRKDLYNIESSYCLSKLTYRTCLGANVDHWVKEMISEHYDSFIKFYKPQGKLLEDYPNLGSDQFILVLMNDAQVEILKGGGNDYVCVDSTTLGTDSLLLTVLVLDERDQGFPVAFMITNSNEPFVLEMFFSTLKEATSITFKPKIFISNLEDYIYKSWNSIMSPPSFRMYSPWIVDEDWRSNLDKITNPEKQVQYYNKLIHIMEETNVQTFEDELDSTYREMRKDPETQEFADFFEIYKSKASAWAHCFRSNLGVNVNEQLERIQTSLKTVYECKMKKILQLERFIFLLMGSIKEHLFDSLISFNNEFVKSMKNDHQTKHVLAVELKGWFLGKKPKHWNVSIPSQNKQYKVRILNTECRCAHSCPSCLACMHGYICSCADSSLKWTVCEHVHMVCMKIGSGHSYNQPKIVCDEEEQSEVQTFTVDEINAENANQTNLIINVPESAYQYMTVPTDGEDGNVLLTFEAEDIEDNAELILGYAEEDPDVNVEERRSLLAQKCQNILNRISSEAQVAAFEQAMASLETDVTFID